MHRCLLMLVLSIQIPLMAVASAKKIVPQKKSTFLPSHALIVLDPGHGGLNKGAQIKYPHTEEKRLALTTAVLTKKYLDQLGYRVMLTRSTDIFIPLMRRVYVANRSHASLFVSIHFNSCPNKLAKGIEVYYHRKPKNVQCTQASKKAASIVLQKSAVRTGLSSRGVKDGNYCVIRETKMPSILVEGGFLTNPQERDKIRQRQNLDKLAKGIAEGIDRFMKS